MHLVLHIVSCVDFALDLASLESPPRCFVRESTRTRLFMPVALFLPTEANHVEIGECTALPLGVFTLVTRGWVASEFLTHASKFNMTPN